MYKGVGRQCGACRECGQPIQSRNSNAAYCSSTCKEKWENRLSKRKRRGRPAADHGRWTTGDQARRSPGVNG
jgi:hypothetical protein